MINENKFGSSKINRWANPIINLKYDKAQVVNNQVIYYATIDNIDDINKFIGRFDKNSNINFNLDHSILDTLTKINNL